MPESYFISKIFELEDIILNDVKTTNTEMHVFFSLKRKTHACPNCGTLTNRIHDYRTSIIKDIPFMGKLSFLHCHKRRYHCPHCQKHFYEKFALLHKYCRITTRLAFYAIQLLSNRQSVRSVAALTGVSDSFIFRRMQDVPYPKPSHLPEVLSIDEFRGNAGGQKFQAILTDAKNHKLFDILPTHSQTELMLYFQMFPNKKQVKYFVTDMNTVYKDLARQYFPNATIVIDRFHVVRYVTWALENVRKRIQKELHPSKRKYFKRSRKLLLTHQNKLSKESMDALEIMLLQSSDLATAYYLKELFYEFMASSTRTEATRKLKFFILAAQTSALKEFKACLTMLGNWSKYILNSFECQYTNGYTEGTNNAIKVIKRNAFGYRNFNNFRNRIFLSLT
ncbi:ISL3 family transposase [Faecalicatena acetigenes]|uniref:ISL3 family transposase n=1 Tax=Faecalicatena acetigenes TaxID=2981790 RepID=A0ABT2TF70_9FIRM|nr:MULTISPECIES: ISL3 family transposase [Lachnospiraceae]MCU6748452.1 ISL3 family transposase [Faecalicatena acetigenes]SCI44976.1 Transposase and inactivated derivatives [uncultured Clostridium sp.]